MGCMSLLSVMVSFSLLVVSATVAVGTPAFFDTACATCHITVASTCDGCHAHGVHADADRSRLNLYASTDKGTYGGGETVTVAVNGGSHAGWVRVVLYDQDMIEVARSTGPDSIGGGAGFPITLRAPAPKNSGSYRWNIAWYGSSADADGASFGQRWRIDPDNPDHGTEITETNEFTVVAGPSPSISLRPGILDFGVTPPGAAGTRTVEVVNRGNALLSVSGITTCSGTGGEFTWTPSSLLVPPGESRPLAVTYSPVGAPESPACLRLSTNDPQFPEMLLMLRTASNAPGQ